jgi:hypothetical protein
MRMITLIPRDERVERFGEGPWVEEPDRIEWRSGQGYPCLMVRHPVLGHWCGYVGLPPGHPWHGRAAGGIGACAHGGINYAEPCNDQICHVPEPGDTDDVWWIGFDCAHYDDLSPGIFPARRILMGTCIGEYRGVAYVVQQVEALAIQARAAAEGRLVAPIDDDAPIYPCRFPGVGDNEE